MDYANSIRFNMGQMPDRYFDLAYLRRVVAHIDSCIRCETHNLKGMPYNPRFPKDHWRHDLLYDNRVQREFDIQQLELLLSEVELCFEWKYFPFQREMVEGERVNGLTTASA